MVKYKVTVDRAARDSLKAFCKYVKEKSSVSAAQKVRKGLMNVIYNLAEMPTK